MTTTTPTNRFRRDRRAATTGIVVSADQTPRISDLVPGAVIYRWATLRSVLLVSDLPCHPDQMASIAFGSKAGIQSQPVVCRRCFATYIATPTPATGDFARPRVMYRHTGRTTLSSPKQPSK